MGAKVTFDRVNRLIVVTQPPDADGRITLNVQVDLYSDGKEDWLADPNLQVMKFPIEPIGGQTVSIGQLGTTYLLRYGWHIKPYEADHELVIEGNLFTEGGEPVTVDTTGTYRVAVTQQVSTLVELRQIYEQALEDIRKVLLNRMETDPNSGVLKVYDDDDATVVFTANVYEDVAATVPYRGRGIERRDKLA